MGKKRERKDTFWQQSDESNGGYFDSIVMDTNPNYRLVVGEAIKRDYRGKERHCWRVYNKGSGKPVSNLRSAPAYRLACIWSVTTHPGFWKREKHKQRMKTSLPKLKGKTADHSRHRCGNKWCCNPGHIRVGSRVANEIDKHFHYFLNHDSIEVSQAFMDTFKGLCKAQGVF